MDNKSFKEFMKSIRTEARLCRAMARSVLEDSSISSYQLAIGYLARAKALEQVRTKAIKLKLFSPSKKRK